MEVRPLGYVSRALRPEHGVLVVEHPGEHVYWGPDLAPRQPGAVDRALQLGMMMMQAMHPECHVYALSPVRAGLVAGSKATMIGPGPPCQCARPGRG